MDFDIYKKRRGIIGTILFHLFLFLVLYFYHFAPAEPVFPDPDGIMVNFGDSETGEGEDEPMEAGATEEIAEAVPEETAPEQSEPVEEISEPVEDVSDPEPVVDEVLTQDDVDAPSMEEIKKKEEAEKKKREEKERLKREETERKKKEETEKKKREEELRKKQEAERKRKEAERKSIEAINNRAKNAFGSSNNTSSGEGIAGGEGNQGKPNGQPDATNYTKGIGSGDGVDWSLSGRSAVSVPRPNSGIQEEGKVVVEIIVDKNGKVVDARPGVIGSTTTDGRLYELAKKAALKAQFNVSSSAPERQKGKITYVFELR